MPVILGREISTAEGELVTLFVVRAIPKRLSGSDTARLLRGGGGLAGVPHPFDGFRSLSLDAGALDDLANRLGSMDVLNPSVTLEADGRWARRFAAERSLLPIAGSDAQTRVELGRACTVMGAFDGGKEFRHSLAQGTIEASVSAFRVHFFSSCAKTGRRFRRG